MVAATPETIRQKGKMKRPYRYKGGELTITITRRVWVKHDVRVYQDTSESYKADAVLQPCNIKLISYYGANPARLRCIAAELTEVADIVDLWNEDTGENTAATFAAMETELEETK